MENSYILYTHKLKGEYAETFKKIEFYCNTAGLDDDSREEHLSELLDMFINAQESGKSVKKIVGSDVAWFCKEFCSDIDFKSRMKSLAKMLKDVVWFIFVSTGLDFLIVLGDMANGADVSLFSSKMGNVGVYAIGLIIMEVCSFFIGRGMLAIIHRFKKIPTQKQRMGFYIVSLILSIVGYGLAVAFMPPIKVPTFVLCILCGIYLAVYYRFIAKKDTVKTSIFDRDEQTQADYNRIAINEFYKENEKRIKKGKAPQTPEAFIEKYRKLVKPSKWSKLSYLVYPLITVVACLLTEFDTAFDLVMFVLVLAVVEFLIARFFYKMEKTFTANVKSFIEAWENDPIILDKKASESEDDDDYDDYEDYEDYENYDEYEDNEEYEECDD